MYDYLKRLITIISLGIIVSLPAHAYDEVECKTVKACYNQVEVIHAPFLENMNLKPDQNGKAYDLIKDYKHELYWITDEPWKVHDDEGLFVDDQLPLRLKAGISFYKKYFKSSKVSNTSKIILFVSLREFKSQLDRRLGIDQGQINRLEKRLADYPLKREESSLSDIKKSLKVRKKRRVKLLRLQKKFERVYPFDEDDYMHHYFNLKEAMITSRLTLREPEPNKKGRPTTYFGPPLAYTYVRFEVDKGMIKTPEKWVERARPYLTDPRTRHVKSTMNFLFENDTDTAFLKELVLPRLDGKRDWMDLGHAILSIASHEELRKDKELRAKIQTLANEHPISYIRMEAIRALSDEKIRDYESWGYVFHKSLNYKDKIKSFHKDQIYCDAPIGREGTSFESNSDFENFYVPKRGQLSWVLDAAQTPKGWLVGQRKGSVRPGFFYYEEGGDLKGHELASHNYEYADNVFRLIEGPEPGLFWVIFGVFYFHDHGTSIYQVDARKQHLTFTKVKSFPDSVSKVVVLENGDVFLDFSPRAREVKLKETTFEEYIKAKNPPVIFTKSGGLKSACEVNAPEH
ncbi:MAG: hypothetical protein ACPGVT_12715 [Maricaulaceae bacterium]